MCCQWGTKTVKIIKVSGMWTFQTSILCQSSFQNLSFFIYGRQGTQLIRELLRKGAPNRKSLQKNQASYCHMIWTKRTLPLVSIPLVFWGGVFFKKKKKKGISWNWLLCKVIVGSQEISPSLLFYHPAVKRTLQVKQMYSIRPTGLSSSNTISLSNTPRCPGPKISFTEKCQA